MAMVFYNRIPLDGLLLLLLLIPSGLIDDGAELGDTTAMRSVAKTGGLLVKIAVIIVLLLNFLKHIGTRDSEIGFGLFPPNILRIEHGTCA